jgi:hypothetical protein
MPLGTPIAANLSAFANACNSSDGRFRMLPGFFASIKVCQQQALRASQLRLPPVCAQLNARIQSLVSAGKQFLLPALRQRNSITWITSMLGDQRDAPFHNFAQGWLPADCPAGCPSCIT